MSAGPTVFMYVDYHYTGCHVGLNLLSLVQVNAFTQSSAQHTAVIISLTHLYSLCMHSLLYGYLE